MKLFKTIFSLIFSTIGLKNISNKIDPNLDMVREARGLKNMLPPSNKKL